MDAVVRDSVTTVPPQTPSEVAGWLLAREAAAGTESGSVPVQRIAAAERVLQRLDRMLARWFGSDGADALLARALDRAKSSHAILAMVQRVDLSGACLTGLTEAAAVVAPEVLTDALVALIGTVLALVGGLVGNDLVLHLVEQGWPDFSRGEPSPTNKRIEA